jgi:sRNA-binding protein
MYGYDEFGEQYMLTPEQQYEAIAEAEFEAFLTEVDYHAKQQSTLEKARAKAAKIIAKKEKRQAREAARKAREAAREAQHAAREAPKADLKAHKVNRGACETVRVETVANAPETATIFTKENVKADLNRCSFLDSMENFDSLD